MDLYRVRFVNRDVGWIMGWDVVFRTSDGGETWLRCPISDGSDLWFIDEKKGWDSGSSYI
jgi:photosystem II stability/assembly factor-like uncharacterized protein